jgi:regulator of sigma E protease
VPGHLANFILAILVYWFVFLRGTVGLAPVVFSVEADSIAEKSGLQIGEQIFKVDGIETKSVSAVAMQLIKRMGEDGSIIIEARKPETDIGKIYHLSINQWLGREEGNVDVFSTLGIGFYDPVIEPVIEEVLPKSAAESAGLKKGDRLISADGININDWNAWVQYVRERADISIDLIFLRDGRTIITAITPLLTNTPEGKIGQVGIRPALPAPPEKLLVKQEYNIFSAWMPAMVRTWETSVFSLQSVKKIIMGDISYKQLSGPISIAKVASQSANSGIYSYLSLLALLSVSLGVLNLLPVPVLDGGHIFFYLIEWFKGSPIPEKIQQIAYQFGMVVVLSVMILALLNDLSRL